jgi:nucleotide-binding universal stress UspA family protein
MMRIVHPTDFSVCAEQARAVAVQLARALGAELLLLHVAVEAPPFREGLMRLRELQRLFEEQRAWVKRALEERAAEARGQGVTARTHIVTGAPASEIVKTARRADAAFIVMGTHCRGVVERFFLGSVADRVVRTASCAVVTIREADASKGPASTAPAPGVRRRGRQ